MIKKIFNTIKYNMYSCYCPFCNGYWNEFNQHGFEFPILNEVKIVGGGKRNHVCPNCSSTDRLRMIYSYLHKETNFLNPKQEIKVLHVAPERLLLELFSNHKYFSYKAIDKFNHGGIVEYGDITELDFNNDYFDLVICNHVLEHIEKDTLAMKEIYRVLKKNGLAILQIPYSDIIAESHEDYSIQDPRLREKHYGQDDHVRIYALKDYKQRLKDEKFETEFLSPYKESWSFDPSKLGLNKKESLLLAFKR